MLYPAESRIFVVRVRAFSQAKKLIALESGNAVGNWFEPVYYCTGFFVPADVTEYCNLFCAF